jgi:hypothetical protein
MPIRIGARKTNFNNTLSSLRAVFFFFSLKKKNDKQMKIGDVDYFSVNVKSSNVKRSEKMRERERKSGEKRISLLGKKKSTGRQMITSNSLFFVLSIGAHANNLEENLIRNQNK